MTQTEEDPAYPTHVAAYLQRTQRRRLPWGSLVANGHLTVTRSHTERYERSELGEVAIALLGALGISETTLNEIASLPFNASAEDLISKLQEIRARP